MQHSVGTELEECFRPDLFVLHLHFASRLGTMHIHGSDLSSVQFIYLFFKILLLDILSVMLQLPVIPDILFLLFRFPNLSSEALWSAG